MSKKKKNCCIENNKRTIKMFYISLKERDAVKITTPISFY